MTKNSFKVPLSLLLVSSLLSVAFGHTPAGSNLPLPPPAAIESITPADLRHHAEFLASDELGGRYTFSPSNAIVARYLASRLRHWGYRGGAADGSFMQRFEMVAQHYNPEETYIEIKSETGPVKFHVGEGVSFVGQHGDADVTGDLVLVPYSAIKSVEVNDSDLKGKIAVVPLSSSSSERDPSEPLSESLDRHQRRLIREVTQSVRGRGAMGVVVLTPERKSQGGSSEGRRERNPAHGRLVFAEDVKLQPTYPVFHSSQASVIEALLKGTRLDAKTIFSSTFGGDVRSLEREGRLHVSLQGPKRTTQNVIGILDGIDPKLKNEYVVFGAHMDHVNSDGQEIYNGADDNASGVAALLEIAQAFAQAPPPRRSIMIIFHTAEEEGLFGSQYFVRHPTVPLSSIVVNFNVDMIGRSRAPNDTNPANSELSDGNTVFLIGSDRLSAQLHNLSEQTNQDTVKMNLDYRYNREDHPQRLYYRSDHWNYAKNNIPVIFYFTGLHEDYHRPTDDVEKLDFEKMARITRLIFATGWRVAQLDERLKLTTHGDQGTTR